MEPEDILGLLAPVTFIFFLVTERLFPRRECPPIRFWNLIGFGCLIMTAGLTTFLPMLLPESVTRHHLFDGSLPALSWQTSSIDSALGNRIAVAITAAVLLLGAAPPSEFRSFSFLWSNPEKRSTETARLRRAVSLLEANGARHVFSMNGLLQWQLMLYRDEAVLARGTEGMDRYPAYLIAVDRALAQGEPVAVVG